MASPFEDSLTPKPERPKKPQSFESGSGERALEANKEAAESLIKECEEEIRSCRDRDDRDGEMRAMKRLAELRKRFEEDKKNIERADIVE